MISQWGSGVLSGQGRVGGGHGFCLEPRLSGDDVGEAARGSGVEGEVEVGVGEVVFGAEVEGLDEVVELGLAVGVVVVVV